MNDTHDQPLKAAGFSPREETPPEAGTAANQRPRWVVPGLVALSVAALLVFFILPTWIDSSDTPTVPADSSTQRGGAEAKTGSGAGATTEGTERSPFAEAQQQKLRKAAQDALQVVLEAQEALQAFGVENWAPEAYLEAVAIAELGDESYRQRQFTEAALSYQEAAAALAQLEDSIPERSEKARASARSAIEAGDSQTATSEKDLLAMLAPNDPELPLLADRIAAIPAVTSALQEAEEAAKKGNTGAAVAAATAGQTADPQHEGVAAALARYREADIDARFRLAMSEGYNALEAEQFRSAANAFSRAQKIRPGATEPQAALSELATAETAWRLRQLAQKGAALEGEEAWRDAVDTYQKALEIDNTLIFARDGIARATPRAELADALSSVLEEPSRLVDARALKAAETLLADALAATPRGPLLDQQTTELSDLLTWAKTPVTITLTSDSQTDVTLLRVKRLGTFGSTQLTLRPGSYTALGVRNGYRDVRINFDIKPGGETVIDVRCQEAI